VVPQDDVKRCRAEIVEPLALAHEVCLVAGGPRRQDSVVNGIAAAGRSDGTVMIHDGVRPFVRPSLMAACLEGVKATGACIPTVAATDTLKQVDADGTIVNTLDRRRIQLAQTPQTFSLDLIRRAHHLAQRRSFTATDDASVAEFAGAAVKVVPGDRDNIKITTTSDLPLARAILARWRGDKYA
jgi:2-C-methyl-D-erythritol 4-phosphate cytidylyltransferase